MMVKIVIRFLLLAAAYMALAGQMSIDEGVAAGLSAALLTSLSLLAASQQRLRFRFTPSVVARQIVTSLPNLLTDSLKLVPRFLGGDRHPGTMSQEFVADPAKSDDPAWWAMFMLTTSLPPNSYVVARLSRPGEAVMHRLAGAKRQ
jgi:hypothetical protein